MQVKKEVVDIKEDFKKEVKEPVKKGVKEDVNIKKYSLDKIKDEYSYTEAVTYKSFTELDNPVIDSDGLIREKNYVTKTSLYTGNSITIIESSDIKKIQQDYKSLETTFDELKTMFLTMMEQSQQQSQVFNRQNKQIEELKVIGSNQAKVIHELQKISNIQRKEIHRQRDEIDKLTQENKQLNNKVERLSNGNAEDDFDNFKPMETIPIIHAQTKSPAHRPFRGFLDTVGYSGNCRTHKRTVEELKSAAYHGEINTLNNIIKSGDVNINGRGMPDSLCAIAKGFKDRTALMLAAKKGRLECIKLLVQNGANLNLLDRDNFTALDFAQQHHHKEVADFLKKIHALNGADIIGHIEENRKDEAKSELKFKIN